MAKSPSPSFTLGTRKPDKVCIPPFFASQNQFWNSVPDTLPSRAICPYHDTKPQYLCILTIFTDFARLCGLEMLAFNSDTRANYLPINGTNQMLTCPPSFNMNASQIAAQNKYCLGGWDSRTTFVKQFRADVGSDKVLLFDTGDILSGTYP